MSSAIVIPSNREDSFNKWCNEWRHQLEGATVILIEDSFDRTFEPKLDNFRHYCWRDIDHDLKDKAWIIPRKTDCVRSYGYLKAYQEGFDYIMTMDDDCYPVHDEPYWVSGHVDELNKCDSRWINTLESTKVRGVPFENTGSVPVAISHGLWTNIPDLDAVTQLTTEQTDELGLDLYIPMEKYYPMCGMNLAWKAEVTPAMYFMLMGKEYGIDRFGDIWAGLISKRIADHLGYTVHSGYPLVRHDKASNVFTNLEKEARGIGINETLWEAIDVIGFSERTWAGCYQELIDQLNVEGEYFTKLKQAMTVWSSLF